jgi:hypothetical protein
MKRTIRLTESELRNMISESVKRVLKESRGYGGYNPNAVYIVFDGTSHYAVYGCDVEDEINTNDAEVVEGPFAVWDDEVNNIVEELNNEAYGTQYDRRSGGYY